MAEKDPTEELAPDIEDLLEFPEDDSDLEPNPNAAEEEERAAKPEKPPRKDKPDADDVAEPGEGLKMDSDSDEEEESTDDDEGAESASPASEEDEEGKESSEAEKRLQEAFEREREAMEKKIGALRAESRENAQLARRLQQDMESRAKKEREEVERRQKEAIEAGEVDPSEVKLRELEDRVTTYEQERQVTALREEVNRNAAVAYQHETQFREAHPDYEHALRFVHEKATPDLLAKGYSEYDVPEVLAKLDLAFAVGIVRQGGNPAEAIYERAKQLGYNPEAGTNGTQKKGVDPHTPSLEEAAKTAGVEKREEKVRPKSLSNTSGRRGGGGGAGIKITQKSLEEMESVDRDRITDYLSDHPDKDFQLETEGHVYIPADI